MGRRFSATRIYTLKSPPLRNGIIEVDDDGTILEITDTGGFPKEMERMEHYNGIIAPGFVNAHCHLELSHLKGKTTERFGMSRFLGEINQLRGAPEDIIFTAALKADQEMFRAGVSAAGDVSNTPVTAEIKLSSKINYYNFIEIFGFLPSRAMRAMESGRRLWQHFNDKGLVSSIVPHSPYSVSPDLFCAIGSPDNPMSDILSIHNQESKDENEFFANGTGSLMVHLKENLGLDASHWKPTGKSSLASVLPFLPEDIRLLLVHNVYTSPEDILFLKKTRNPSQIFMVLCPNSNIYIGNGLPPVRLFRDKGMKICIGTDSLASNRRLSVVDELITLQTNFPDIETGELLTWACLNGADALGMQQKLGSLEVGKRPGLVLIKGIDFTSDRLTLSSKAVRLV